MRIAVLMPAFDEEGRLAQTLEELAAFVSATRAVHATRGASTGPELTVFLVDDGSSPAIDPSVVARASSGAKDGEPAALRLVMARHAINLGQGAALETARRLAIAAEWAPASGPFQAFVTMDSDGQHRPSDVLRLAEAIASGADVALGDRFAGGSNVPASRRVLLHLARGFEWLTTGQLLSDVHNGLRAFGPRVIGEIQIRQNRMAHASEITRSIARARAAAALRGDEALRVVEVPVSVRYTDASLAKGQRASGAVAIVVDLFQGFLFGSQPR